MDTLFDWLRKEEAKLNLQSFSTNMPVIEKTKSFKNEFGKNLVFHAVETSSLNQLFILLNKEQLESIVSILVANELDEFQIQESLVEIIGYDNLDFISLILENKDNFIYEASKRKKGRALIDAELSLAMQRQQALNEPLALPSIVAAEEVSYPHVYGKVASSSKVSVFGTEYKLPSGTVRKNEKDYEEFIIPYDKNRLSSDFKLREIKEFNGCSQAAFNGYRSLNPMQSLVFPLAYQTNENLLICAPTGAGKTDVAMMVILKTIEDHLVSNNGSLVLDKAAFKIVYVAPMKALAAEIVEKFSSRLKFMKVQVRECTGDMQLSKNEVRDTQIIVTTPEKWDVITRKTVGDTELVEKVKLLIIDEVHLLHDDRGPVLESIVARTLREVEMSQRMIRIVGLSATLPNFVDVGHFLRVNPQKGLFYFGASFRPVPLTQTFIGVKGKSIGQLSKGTNQVCYDKMVEFIKGNHQVMIFVHSRNETVKSAKTMIELCKENGTLSLFSNVQNDPKYDLIKQTVSRCKSREVKELFNHGFGVHHAGMLRSDRTLVEKLFRDGHIRVLCCTATLAWGINLPAHAVIIKGTNLYDASKGEFVDLGILDVLQIFGRAGRPQYETHGEGIIITSHDKLAKYLGAIMQQTPIESQFHQHIVDNLNAEINLGTVSNIREAINWLGYTYFNIRLKKNPLSYGISLKEYEKDPSLHKEMESIVRNASQRLANLGLIGYDTKNGFLRIKDLGRICSLFYLKSETIEIFSSHLKARMNEKDILSMISKATEFQNLKVRDSESSELEKLRLKCYFPIKDDINSITGKVNILMQCYIGRVRIDDFALISDLNYVQQNASRIIRAVFEICMTQNWGPASSKCLVLCKCFDKQLWLTQHFLYQFPLPGEVLRRFEDFGGSFLALRDMSRDELAAIAKHPKQAPLIHACINQFPYLEIEASIQPITKNVLRVNATLYPEFKWNDKIHGSAEPFWVWIEDADNELIYHSESILFTKKSLDQPKEIHCFIPVKEPLPSQIYVRVVSDRWLQSEFVYPISFKHLILPDMTPEHTELLPLSPVPLKALHNALLESLYCDKFEYFNPVQSQVFHSVYHGQFNCLIGAPTGSGKTIIAELAVWNALRNYPKSKIVYIAPLKALVRERMSDWNSRLSKPFQLKIIELTGDVTPDLLSIQRSNIIITTPEKWDSVSRHWKERKYIQNVSLIIVDEIHLLGGDRGPIIESIIARMKIMSKKISSALRIVGLSTALANAKDLANWMEIPQNGLFNFRPSVRPVPLEVRMEGFSGKHYCPRMASMNKPIYAAILNLSEGKPVIVFVSSRRQTRLTFQGLSTFCAMDDSPNRFLKMKQEEMEILLSRVSDKTLKTALGFGIGLHHAGLVESDRQLVEELFLHQKIQVIIATSTLAWGVNFPAHLVIIKGTEYFDPKLKEYVDYPITDVLQMMGRAGRPQFDVTGKAFILLKDSKKNFYKKFLYEPFPVESCLANQLTDHLNAEINNGSIRTITEAIEYMKNTFLYQRMLRNPTFYDLEDFDSHTVDRALKTLVSECFDELQLSFCISKNIESREDRFEPLPLGRISSFFYLSHKTIRLFYNSSNPSMECNEMFQLMTSATEFDQVPVRHNEDIELEEFCKLSMPSILSQVTDFTFPSSKVFVLLSAYLMNIPYPITDFLTDRNTILEQSIRIVEALIEVCVFKKFTESCMSAIYLLQMVKSGRSRSDASCLIIPELSNVKKLPSPHLGDYINNPSLIQKISLSSQEKSSAVKLLSAFGCVEIKAKQEVFMASFGKPFMVNIDIIISRPVVIENIPLRFPKKIKEHSWFVLLASEDEIVEMKRIRATCSLHFELNEFNVRGVKNFTLYLLSDTLIGLDQTFEIKVDFN